MPDQVTIVIMCMYFTGREAEVDMFHISNRQDKDLSFEISWPGDMITVKPGRGTVKSR